MLIILFLALRVGGLLFFHPYFNNVCPIEEYYRGALGWELVKGLSMPYWNYRADDSGGGSLVLGVIAAVFFKFFGPSAFVLKSIPVLISLGALLIWFQMLYREFSSRCAWYFALFFILAPSPFQSWSSVALGDHYETMFLSAAALQLFLRMWDKKASPAGMGTAFLLGVLCGFGTWFAYIFALSVFALLMGWAVQDLKFWKSPVFWVFAAGFLAGFSPWVISNLNSQFGGLKIHGGYLWWHIHPVRSLYHWKRYYLEMSFAKVLFSAFSQPHMLFKLPGLWVGWIYAALLLAPVICRLGFSFRSGKSRKLFSFKKMPAVSLYFILYAVIHTLAVQLTDFKATRYMLPLMPAVFFAWARLMVYFESFPGRARFWSRLFFALPLLSLGFAVWLSMLSPAYALLLLKTPGYAYDYMASIPECDAGVGTRHPKIRECFELHENMSKRLSPVERRGLWNSLAAQFAELSVYRDDIPMAEFSGFTDAASRASFYFHFGRFLFQYRDYSLKEAFVGLETLWPKGTAAYRLGAEGIFYSFGNKNLESAEKPDEELWGSDRVGFFRAMGIQYARYWRHSGFALNEFNSRLSQIFPYRLSEADRTAFVSGMGIFYAQVSFEKPVCETLNEEDILKIENLEDIKAFFKGIGRAYEISYRFFPAACETWAYPYSVPFRDLQWENWVTEGRSEIPEAESESIAAIEQEWSK